MDRTANPKGRKRTELNISHFNHFCASLSLAIHPTLAPKAESQQVQDTLSPITEQVFLICKICFLSGLQEEMWSAQSMFRKLMGD